MSANAPPLIAFLGAGNMAEALARSLLARGVPAARLAAGEKDEARRAAFAAATGIAALADNAAAVRGSAIAVLAVKPQQAEALLAETGRHLGPERLVVSIMAGWSTTRIAALLPPGARVVRAMPNTPLQVRRGVVGLCAGAGAERGDLQAAADLFTGAAKVFLFPDEAQLDAVTAVSGSGPAYVFAFLEALEQAAQGVGLAAAPAREMVRETCAGALALLEAAGEEPAALRAKVTSPGGTTEAALRVLAEARLDEILRRAVAAARARARELGR